LKTVGVFDSGVGGLSVLRALRAEMPGVHFVYVADSAHAPYGERSALEVCNRALHITDTLQASHGIDLLVVACNTATAHAIQALRSRHTDLPIVGVEPALKPAAAASRTGHVGVLATRGTVQSERFKHLRAEVQAAAKRALRFTVQACDGLASAIERHDQEATRLLCQRHVERLIAQGGDGPAIDTVVLGCTHYPFAADGLREHLGPGVTLVDTGAAVARRTRAVLGLEAASHTQPVGGLTLLATGSGEGLARAARQWLGSTAPVALFGH
jgi:glutamate racemase